ncbi:hypothetical protein DUNSADRAFT_17689 [Dunaliella salina]|uniref:Uncharacterized protein n=1 Tax=Dunaliella salina TaxID=3046 RepID=A0ABQ7G195_DUNSA|nr:hypothetical protein DUNSADRAFT_17689 [Dunaliella salina]|eukprot:KAF5828387.1 hypothetical protein DUNSADRAFT_17689 [Dunaliella salina]
MGCLAPFPFDHPYHGYSAPGVAATACSPPPAPRPTCPSPSPAAAKQPGAGLAHTGLPGLPQDSRQPGASMDTEGQTDKHKRGTQVHQHSSAEKTDHETREEPVWCNKEGQEMKQCALQSSGPSGAAAAARATPQQLALQAHQAEAEAVDIEAAVLDLWPAFGEVQGKEAILGPGDAVYCPAGCFVHMESLQVPSGSCPAKTCHDLKDSKAGLEREQGNSSSSSSSSSSTRNTCSNSRNSRPSAGISDAEVSKAPEAGVASGGASLPGNVMLVCNLWAASPAVAPRSVGAMEQQAARVMERWAKHCTGTVCRVREVLLAAADQFDGAAQRIANLPALASLLPTSDTPAQRDINKSSSSSSSSGGGSGSDGGSNSTVVCSLLAENAGTQKHINSSVGNSGSTVARPPSALPAQAQSLTAERSWVSFPASAAPAQFSGPQGASDSSSGMAAHAAFSAWPPPHWTHSSRWQDGPPPQQQLHAGHTPEPIPAGHSERSSKLNQEENEASSIEDSKMVSKGSSGSSVKGNNSALGRDADSRAPWPPTWAGLESLPGWRQVRM